jgi:poly(3-hydroxybutyrate) depolymerase
LDRLPLHSSLVALFAFIAAVGCSGPARQLVDQAAVAQPVSPPVQQPAALTEPLELGREPLDYSLHLPPHAAEQSASGGLTVLVALHGMGGNGPDFSRRLIEDADRNGWVLVAPTINYRDWRDPEQVRRDGADVLPALKALIDELPSRTGLALRKRVLLYGFSRGGQTAHRFALFYPKSVLGVASFSCGTYTLPTTLIRQGSDEIPLKFPYGVGDIEQYEGQPFDPSSVRQVDFWLGVGGRDNVPADVPHQWDAYIGTTRVDRAQSFSQSLTQLGAHTGLTVFPNASHEVTDEMRGQALAHLAQLVP